MLVFVFVFVSVLVFVFDTPVCVSRSYSTELVNVLRASAHHQKKHPEDAQRASGAPLAANISHDLYKKATRNALRKACFARGIAEVLLKNVRKHIISNDKTMYKPHAVQQV